MVESPRSGAGLTDNRPTSCSTAAIVLSASEFPHHSDYNDRTSRAQRAAFSRTHERVVEYLRTIGIRHLNEYRNDPRKPDELLLDIRNWLTALTASGPKEGLRDVVFYFVGHGAVIDGEYYLATSCVHSQAERASSVNMTDLFRTLKEGARRQRRFAIIDACFASNAYDAARRTVTNPIHRGRGDYVYPTSGLSLLCSSAAHEPSRTDLANEETIFSGLLLRILTASDEESRQLVDPDGHGISLQDLRQMLARFVETRHEGTANFILPHLFSPECPEGDLAEIPLFPNPLHDAALSDFQERTPDTSGYRHVLRQIRSVSRRHSLKVVTLSLLGIGIATLGFPFIPWDAATPFGRGDRPIYLESILPDPSILRMRGSVAPQDVTLILWNVTSRSLECAIFPCSNLIPAENVDSEDLFAAPSNAASVSIILAPDQKVRYSTFRSAGGWFLFFVRTRGGYWHPYDGMESLAARNLYRKPCTVLKIGITGRRRTMYVWEFSELDQVPGEIWDVPADSA